MPVPPDQPHFPFLRRWREILIYPSAVLAIANAIVLGILIFVVPKFKEIFKGFAVPLPSYTLVLLAISEAFRQWWWAGLIALALFALALKKIRSGRPLPRVPDFVMILSLGVIVGFVVIALFLPMVTLMERLR